MKQAVKSLSNKKESEKSTITVNRPFEERKKEILGRIQDILLSADDLLKTFFKTPQSSVSPEEYRKKFNEVLVAYGVETHIALLETTSEHYQTLLGEFCKQIIKEYDCQTPSEKALAEIMTGAYVRHLRCAERLEYGLGARSLSPETIKFISVMGKELDRANRTYISALFTLKQIKSSSINLNIKATTSFIAQNQQINVTNKKGVDQ